MNRKSIVKSAKLAMELSEDQKLKIEAEEEYRSKVRKRAAKELEHYVPTTQPKKSFFSGCTQLFLVIAGLGIVSVAVLSSVNPGKQMEKARRLREQTENTSSNVQTDTDKRLGISRKNIVDALRKDGFVFQKAADVDGQESYMAINKAASIVLTGPANNLVQAGITVELGGTDINSTVLSQTYILSLAGAIAPESVKWIADDTAAHKDVSQPYKSSKVFNGNKFLLSYQPKMFMALFISPE